MKRILRFRAPTPTRTRRRPTATIAIALALGLAASACGSGGDAAFDDVPVGSATVVAGEDVEFAEISPFARFASASGDFTSGRHATFGIFGAGAAAPPHTHSGSYYAVVLSGEMNNPFGTESDPPTLGPGSFWAVPAEDQHVTACLSPDSECSFFFHSAGAFDFNQIDELNEPRSGGATATPVDELDLGPLEPYTSAARVWGDADNGPHGMVITLDAGVGTGQLAHRGGFTLVPASGRLTIELDDDTTAIEVGGLVEAEPNTPHELTCGDGGDCIFYLFSSEALDISEA